MDLRTSWHGIDAFKPVVETFKQPDYLQSLQSTFKRTHDCQILTGNSLTNFGYCESNTYFGPPPMGTPVYSNGDTFHLRGQKIGYIDIKGHVRSNDLQHYGAVIGNTTR